MTDFFSHPWAWPVVVSAGLLALYFVLSRRKKPAGEPVSPATVAGMFAGNPAAWAEFNRLLKQPLPPDPHDQIRAVVEEVLARKRPG
jgi:hypothetical protein